MFKLVASSTCFIISNTCSKTGLGSSERLINTGVDDLVGVDEVLYFMVETMVAGMRYFGREVK